MALRNDSRTTKIEFDVNLTCNKCGSSVAEALASKLNITVADINVDRQSVIVETSLPSQTVKEVIESTGKRAVLKGYGSHSDGSAVAEFKNISDVFGVIRFHQLQDVCTIDGTVDGLSPGEHGLHIHELGDLSKGCDSIGDHFNPTDSQHGGPSARERHYGDLGNIKADNSGRASFVFQDHIIKVSEIIGRSIAVTSDRDDFGLEEDKLSKVNGNSGNILACAIIARSSGLFANPKRICQCDGISIWDEAKPLQSSL